MQKLKPKCKNKVLTFITVSRLSGEKGFDRMLKFAELLQLNKIEYIWDVYGNVNNDYNNNIVNKFAKTKVKFNGVIRNPMPLINQADYLVQLSDTEGFAYSVYEALQCKTPCIITPFASGNEQIQSGVNGYIVPFDLKDIDFKQIVNNIPTVKDFKEIGSEESWLNFLENGKENNSKSIKRVQR
jgi:glycosyltransferase involved in cell wall biosynthesis